MDLKALEAELEHARLARLEAEAASIDVEAMIWEVQHVPAKPGCFAWLFTGCDPDQLPS